MTANIAVNFELWATVVLLGFALLAIVSLISFHRNNRYQNFNLLDLITCKEGKISRPASMEVGAWLVFTWGFVVQINNNTLTDWYSATYVAAFVIRGGWSAWLSSKNNGHEQK